MIEPDPTVDDEERRRQSRILTSLVLIAMLFPVSGAAFSVQARGGNVVTDPQVFFGVITTLVLYISYRIAKTGRYELAMIVAGASTTGLIVVSASTVGGQSGYSLLFYFVANNLIATLFLRPWMMIIIFALQSLMLAVSPLWLPDVPASAVIEGPFAFNVVVSSLALLAAQHRDRLDRERRRRLRVSEQRYRALIENISDIVSVISPDGRILSLNEVGLRLFGHPPDQVIGMDFIQFIYTEDVPLALRTMQTILRGEQPSPIELRTLTRSGQIIWLEVSVSLNFEDGVIASITTVSRDITERKQAEFALRTSEERYRIISDQISDYATCYRIEPDGSVYTEWVTESFTRLTGYTPDERQALTPQEFIHPDDFAQADADWRTALNGGETEGEYRIRIKSGEYRWVRVVRKPVFSDTVRRLYNIVQDITERKEVEERKLRAALEHERYLLTTQFVSAISHDFRTWLATIETSRYIVTRSMEKEDTARALENLKTIHHAVEHLTQQIENLQTVASVAHPKRRALHLGELLRSVATEHEARAEERGIQLIVESPDDLPRVFVDESELRRALHHLMTNAILHTGAGGSVTLRAGARNGHVFADVADTGVGIAPQHLALVFDPFYRADHARSTDKGGIGLGLPIVKMVVEANGGEVSVQSELGRGTTFTLSFPRHYGGDN